MKEYKVFENRLRLYNQLREEILKESFNFCNSPIKGEPTKGKIKWRGLKQCIQGSRYWIEQRGKRISPILEGNKILLSSYRDLVTTKLSEDQIQQEIVKIKSAWND